MTTHHNAFMSEKEVRFDKSRGIIIGQVAMAGFIDILPGDYLYEVLGELTMDSEGEMAVSYQQGQRLAHGLLAENIAAYRFDGDRRSTVVETLRKTTVLHALLKDEIMSTLAGEEIAPEVMDPALRRRYELYTPLEAAMRKLVSTAHKHGQPERWDPVSLAQWYDEMYPARNESAEPVLYDQTEYALVSS